MSLISRKLDMAAAGAGGAGGGSYVAINVKSSGVLNVLDHTTSGTVSALDTIQVGGPGNDGYSCQWASDDSFIVATSEGDPRVHLINSSNPASLSSSDSENAGWRSRSIALSPDDAYVATGYWDYNSYNPSIQIFSISSGSLSLSSTTATTGNTNTGSGSIESMDFSPDGNYLAVLGRPESSSNGRLWLYSFSSGSITLAATYTGGHNTLQMFNSVRFSPDGSMIGAGMSNKIRFFTYTSNSITNTGEESIVGSGVAYGFAWRPDSSQALICTSGNKRMHVYDISNNGQGISAGPTYQLSDNSACFDYTPDGNYIGISADQTNNFVLLDSSDPTSLSVADTLTPGIARGDRGVSWSHN
tara:strand:- start:245 stop:1318 length:1074 start_codon:yes stop_codon:yes gene_type:complete